MAEDDAPMSVFPAMLSPSMEPDKTLTASPLTSPVYPIDHGAVRDWDAMERLWEKMFFNKLNIDPKQRRLVVADAPVIGEHDRPKSMEVLFENFGLGGLMFASADLMSLYAAGRTSGTILSVGEGVTYASTVLDGYQTQVPRSLKVGGRDLTAFLQEHLVAHGLGEIDLDTVRTLKEQLCFISVSGQTPSPAQSSFKLPDGQVIDLKEFASQALEPMFTSVGPPFTTSYGLPGLVANHMKNMDQDNQSVACEEIILTGGGTLAQGFSSRLKTGLLSADLKTKIVAPSDRSGMTWLGASILGSLTSASSLFISQADYEEHGANCLSRS